jgi:hypothetical protein
VCSPAVYPAGVRLRGSLNDYELRAWTEVGIAELGAVERVADREEAARVLRRLLDEDAAASFGLRHLADEVLHGWARDDDDDLVAHVAAAVGRGSLLLTRSRRVINISDTFTRIDAYEPPPLEAIEDVEVFLRVYSEADEWPTLEVESESEDWPTVSASSEIEELDFATEGEIEELGFAVREPGVNAQPATATR